MVHGNIRSSVLLASLLSVSAWGCGGPADLPDLGRVSGTVKLNGEPLPDATVEFTPEAKGRGSIATTDANGFYMLKYTNDYNGAVVGKHTVRITTATAGHSGEGGAGREGTPERVPPQYNSASDLIRDVKSGSNTFDFEIESSGETFPTRGDGGAKIPEA